MARSTDDADPTRDALGEGSDEQVTAEQVSPGGSTAVGASSTDADEDTAATTERPTTKTAAQKARSGDPSTRAEVVDAKAAKDKRDRHKVAAQRVGNPSWYVPVMLGLMLLGLIWVVTFYITGQEYPVKDWGNWNLGAGFALILVGFAMTTRWR